MVRTRLLVLLCCTLALPAAPVRGQVLTDPADPRFPLVLAARRLELHLARRDTLAGRLIHLAEAVVAAAESGSPRGPLLARVAALADTLDLLEGEVAEAHRGVAEARTRVAAAGVDPEEVAALAPDGRRSPGAWSRLESAAPLLLAALDVAAAARAREARAVALGEELRLFQGGLRLFDETGMPPSARAQSGGDPGPGCPVSSCPAEAAFLPADAPWEHARPGEALADREVRATYQELRRLEDWLARRAGAQVEDTPGWGQDAGRVRWSGDVGLGASAFHAQGESRRGSALLATATWAGRWELGEGRLLAVEPTVGGRSLRLDPGSTSEVAAEVRESVSGGSGSGGVSWQVSAWQKARHLSQALPLPVYLEPGRLEAGAAASVRRPAGGWWFVEAGGGVDAVRYADEGWRSVDRRGVTGSAGVGGQTGAAGLRVSAAGSRHALGAGGRVDTRLGLAVDASVEGPTVLRLSAGLAWNASNRAGFGYRSARGAAVAAIPWGSSSIQAYGALAHLAYADESPPGTSPLAPSDEDRGAMAALQLTRPLDADHALVLSLRWARSRTGLGADLVQRLGVAARVTFRGWGRP